MRIEGEILNMWRLLEKKRRENQDGIKGEQKDP